MFREEIVPQMLWIPLNENEANVLRRLPYSVRAYPAVLGRSKIVGQLGKPRIMLHFLHLSLTMLQELLTTTREMKQPGVE